MIFMNMNYDEIAIIGDGWGAVAAYKSLKPIFGTIWVCSSDRELLKAVSKDKVFVLTKDCCDKVLIFAGYKPIVPKEILNKNICINIHYSLLPQYRGFHSTVWAMLNDEPYLGLTVHLMNEFIDDGPVIFQYSVKNDFVSTSRDYMEHFNQHIESCLGEICRKYLESLIEPVIQDKTKASWVGKRKLADCQVNFGKNLAYQKAFFRALVAPYPLPFILFKGQKYIVKKVAFHNVNVATDIGRILNIDDEGIWVKCKDGYMILKELMDESQQLVPWDNFKIGQYLK